MNQIADSSWKIADSRSQMKSTGFFFLILFIFFFHFFFLFSFFILLSILFFLFFFLFFFLWIVLFFCPGFVLVFLCWFSVETEYAFLRFNQLVGSC
ncbi:hypothetical protein BZA77DRAFT_36533 [Pyronema omphalodes]|nr:hypothetical protein BZA77DRAFT_36533 [Pyronema omphalodes]